MTNSYIYIRRSLQSLATIAFVGTACLLQGFPPAGALAAPPATAATASPVTPSEISDPRALLQVRIEKPLRVLDNPWLRQVWPLLEESPSIRNGLEPGMAERLIETRRFLERVSGTSWRDAVEKLTEGGIELSLQKRSATIDPRLSAEYPFASLVVIHAADEKLLGKFLSVADRERREHSAARSQEAGAEGGGSTQVSRYTYRGQNCTKVLKSADRPGEYFSAVGRRFLFATDEKVLEQAISRCLDGVGSATTSPKSVASEPLVRFTLRLDGLREFPQAREMLQLPASHPWIAPFVGTWDSFRRSERVDGTVQLEETGFRLRIRCAAGTAGMSAGLRDAITPSPREPLLPSLQIPNSVCTLNLYRDASLLWQNRSEWLSSEGAKLVEEWNRQPQGQVPDLDFVKALPYLGPNWRLALALPGQPVERSKRRDLLPAFAVVVDLRDEAAFRREVLDRLEGFLKSSTGKKHGRVEAWDHHGTSVSQFHWHPPVFPPGFQRPHGDPRNPRGGARTGDGRSAAVEHPESKPGAVKSIDAKPGDDKPQNPPQPAATALDIKPESKPGETKPADAKPGENKPGTARREGVAAGRSFRGGPNRMPYHGRHRRSGISMFRHMRPGFAIRKGQLIVGSTGEIIRQAIDELERQAQAPTATPAIATISGEQFLSLDRLAEHLRSRERTLLWRLRSAEVPEEQAKQELAAFSAILTQLGDVTYRETATDTSLLIEVRLGKPAR